MGGKALLAQGIETKRVCSTLLLNYYSAISDVINKELDVETYMVRYYSNKETHGDLDILLKADHNFHNKGIDIGDWVQKTFPTKGIFVNNGVISFEYDNFQIDLIMVKESNWEVSKCYFDFDPSGNIIGKMAHKFNLKYGFEGLGYAYRGFGGNVNKNINISKDNRKIFEFLGFSYDEYLKGFDSVQDIFEYVIRGKYFNAEHYQMENLNRIDRKRNKKRKTYQEFLEYINSSLDRFSSGYVFNKDKDSYIDVIDAFFPDANFKIELEKAKKRDEENKLMASKFNGKLIMAKYPNLIGKELGVVMFDFKESFGDEYRNFLLNNTPDVIMQTFGYYLFNNSK